MAFCTYRPLTHESLLRNSEGIRRLIRSDREVSMTIYWDLAKEIFFTNPAIAILRRNMILEVMAHP